jgi:hypothetical protein
LREIRIVRIIGLKSSVPLRTITGISGHLQVQTFPNMPKEDICGPKGWKLEPNFTRFKGIRGIT